MSRSAYVAKAEAKDCVACGKCVEFCPAGAVKLGQKLCKKDGSAVTYPKQELPDAVKWGKEKWSPDYRDKNRINCNDTGTAPCKTACPAHIAVQGYLKMAAQGRYTDALALIKRITLSRQFAAEFAIRDARRLAQEQLLMKRLLLMMLSALSLKRTLTVKQDIFLKK